MNGELIEHCPFGRRLTLILNDANEVVREIEWTLETPDQDAVERLLGPDLGGEG